jgi:PAS domain S-box-containing protein
MASGPSESDSFRVLFEAVPDAMLLADSDSRYVDANPAACQLLQRSLDELLSMRVADVTPAGVDVDALWREFLSRGEMGGEYTLQRPDGSAVEVEFHATANVLPGRHLSILRDITARKEAERERDEAVAGLREAHDRAHHIALTLQRIMLPPAVAVEGVHVATRYLPASDAMAIGGDWYDLLDLGQGAVAVTVGDVMGHGVAAAGIMGQLRSALSAAMHADPNPARAIGVLDAYARSLYDPLIATAFAALFDRNRRELTYSNAGHLPPLLLTDGVSFLDQATAPPLAATPSPERRPQASVRLPPHATIVLYTDGLIEQRGRDIDEGLNCLADVAKTVADQDCETFAATLLAELLPADGDIGDDVALLVLKL